MKNLLLICIIFAFTGISNLFAQVRLENWQSITSLTDVNTSDIDSKGRIWGGCFGGIFVYNPSDQTFKVIRNTEGLISLDITLIKFDINTKKMIVGTADGVLEIIDEDFNIKHITDIKAAKFPNSKIYDIFIKNDLAYIGGGFGLTVFNIKDEIFLESVFKIGTFADYTPVQCINLTDTHIWVATESGAASASLNSVIANPSSWKVYTKYNGLYENEAYSVSALNGIVYIATKQSISKIENDTVTILRKGAAWESFGKLLNNKNELFYSNGFNVYRLDGTSIDIKQFSEINGFRFLPSDNSLMVYIRDKGIGILKDTTMKYIYPNSPASNLFQSISLDEKGVLWAATDVLPRGRGFSKFDGNSWKIFNLEKYPQIKSNHYFNIKAISGNKYLLSSWGNGFLILEEKANDYKFQMYDTTNSTFLGISNARNYIIPGQSAEDKKGVIWAVNYGENSTGPHLVAMDKNNKFYSFTNPTLDRKRYVKALTIDNNGTKWIGSVADNGLIYYNENATLDNMSDDKTGVFTTSNSSIYSETQNCLAVDQEGLVWIGTPNGLNCIINPGSVLTNQNTIFRKITILGNKAINSLMVDAINYKWVGTNEGIWVLNPDATEVVANFNVKNSDLLSDEIMSLASNFDSGIIYIGTRKGLNVVESNQIKPGETYNIECHPQPFVVSKDKELIIKGLAINSDVRILTLDGNLIRKLSAEGNVVVWDGRTDDGTIAPTGVYLISAMSLTTENKSYAKIAVVDP